MFKDIWCNCINGAEMINLSRYHHYSQEDKNYQGEDGEFTRFMFASSFDAANIVSEVKKILAMLHFSLACAPVFLCVSV
jgi:hypothetical protein